MKRSGQLFFAGAVVAALALYALTAPEGLPWNQSTHLALAYLGEIVRLPVMPHPIWGCYVQVFGGAVKLSVVMAALAAGLVAVLVNRYFAWRFAASAALVWIFLPGVWNRAITGERGICLVAMAVVAAWAVNGVVLRVLRKARELRAARRATAAVAEGDGLGVPSAHEAVVKRGKVNRIAGWVAAGAAGVFAVVSLTLHDYRYGEAASVYAKGIVEEAGERVIVLNGVCDDQIVDAASRRVRKEKSSSFQTRQDAASTIALRNDDTYRTNLLTWVKSAFPTETNLWVAAQVSPQAFADAALLKFPDRFYLMNGKSTTLEQWERRWEAFKPYLGSSDPFARIGRRTFGYEGNAVGNALTRQDAAPAAYALYKRIYTEIDPGNISALLNMSEMIRRGHVASGDEKNRVREETEKFFKDAFNRKHARELVRAAGPIRADPALLEKMAAEAKRRIAAKVAAGEKVECSPEFLSLAEWNNEMVELMDKGECVRAGRIARAILSNPKWKGFVSANSVMGSVAAQEGDYVSSEAFFRVVTDTTNVVPAVVLNDYADTLMHLGKLDEAERQARRAVKASKASFWVARLTLAEVLERREKIKVRGQERKVDEAVLSAFAVDAASRRVGKDVSASSLTRQDAASTGADEIRLLLKSVLSYAPAKVCDQIRKEHREYVR